MLYRDEIIISYREVDMKFLVYGGTGYIGSKLVEYLLRNKHTVANVSRRVHRNANVSNYDYSDNDLAIIDDFNPDRVIYLSACFDNSDIDSIVEVNITRPIKVLNAINILKKSDFIYIGSYWQFGNADKKDVPIDHYSASKKAMTTFFDYYNEYTDVTCKEIVLYGTYGESDGRGKLVDYIISSIKGNKEIELTEGNQELNLVHVDGVCKSIEQVSRNEFLGNKFQIISDRNYTPIQIIKMLETVVHLPVVNFGVIPYRKVELMKINKSNDYHEIVVSDDLRAFFINSLNEKLVE